MMGVDLGLEKWFLLRLYKSLLRMDVHLFDAFITIFGKQERNELLKRLNFRCSCTQQKYSVSRNAEKG